MPRAFKFRFDALQRLRQVQEEKAKREFAEQMHQVNALSGDYEGTQRSLSANKTKMATRQTGDLDMNTLHNSRRYINGLYVDGIKQAKALQDAQQALEEKRIALAKATQQRKIVDKLYEKEFASYQKDVARDEQKVLDDIGRHSLSAMNESGKISTVILAFGALIGVGNILFISAMFAFGFMDKVKAYEILAVVQNRSKVLTNEKYAVYEKADAYKAENEKIKALQAGTPEGEKAVDTAFAEQNRILDQKRKMLTEMSQRIKKVQEDVEAQKKNVELMQTEIKNQIKRFEEDKKKAEELAQSEGVARSVRIFNNMEPADVARIISKDIENKTHVYEATMYLRAMREEQAAEIMAAMAPAWQEAVKEEFKRPARLYQN